MKKAKVPAKRVYVLAAFMAIWGIGIGARLYFLQVVRSAEYIERAKDQQEAPIEITPRRGDILDTDGNELAISVKVDSVFARPKDMKNPQESARVLSQVLNLPLEDLSQKFTSKKSFLWVQRKISDRQQIGRAHV